jgi:hypothetical protein
LGLEYNPANSNITIPKLKNLKNQAIEKNNSVVEAYNQITPKQDSRAALYNQLSQKATRIKDFVKSQYGVNSSEYNLIKGLKI